MAVDRKSSFCQWENERKGVLWQKVLYEDLEDFEVKVNVICSTMDCRRYAHTQRKKEFKMEFNEKTDGGLLSKNVA